MHRVVAPRAIITPPFIENNLTSHHFNGAKENLLLSKGTVFGNKRKAVKNNSK